MPGFRHIAIAGATGASGAGVGSFVLDELLAKLEAGEIASLRVLGRPPASEAKENEVAAIRAKGVAFHAVDYSDEAQMQAALTGCDALVSCLGGPAIPSAELALFRAAAVAGVSRVFPSQFTSDLDVLGEKVNAYHSLKAQVVASLRSDPAFASLSYTLIVTGIFLDLVFSPFSGWHVTSTPPEVFIAPPYDARISGTARRDIARFVAQTLTDPDTARTHNATLRCIAAEWTQEDAIKAYEDVTGTPLIVHRLSLSEANGHPKLEAAYGSGAKNNFAIAMAEEYYYVPKPWNGTDWYGNEVKADGLRETMEKKFGGRK